MSGDARRIRRRPAGRGLLAELGKRVAALKPGACAAIVLLFIFLYKLGDSMATALATPFYLDMGFSMTDIGVIAKNAGLWASVIGGLLAAVFGAITFLPVYLQIVKGVDATAAGLRLLPLMVGLLSASISSSVRSVCSRSG